jgi:NtrC-family two-component system sensor histidine kinase KinB
MMRWTLRKKILLGYGLVLFLLALALGWSFTNLLRLGSASEAILSENYQSIRAADDMLAALERQDSGVLLYLLGYEEEGLQQYRTYQVDFSKELGRARGNVTIEGEQNIIDRIEAADEYYQKEMAAVSRSGAAPDSAYRNRMLPAFQQVRRAVTRLRRLNQKTAAGAADRAEAVATQAVWSVGGVGVAALLLGLAFSVVLSNRLVRPLRRVREATHRIAEGDYDVTVPARTPGVFSRFASGHGSDELGRLASAFNDMAAQLRSFRAMNLERITAEQRKTETVIDSIDDGLVAVDTDLRVMNMNPVAAHLFEIEGGVEAARERHFLEAIDDRRLFEHVRQTVASGRAPAFDGEEGFLSVDRDGRTHHYQINVSPVRGAAEGERLGAVLLLRDVTRLRELDRLKSEFVATASHELKTPLTSIGMSMGLLTERLAEGLDENNRALLEAAGEEVERLQILVEDLLDLSKIESGRVEMHPAPARMGELAERALQNARAPVAEHDVELHLNVPSDLPDAWADPEQVVQVFTNLLSNAVRYADTSVRIGAEATDREVRVAVTDDGPGIAPEMQERIFEKFTQGQGDTAPGGSGLGLAVCREIVERHGGTIAVASASGEGATFTFTLPLASEASGAPTNSEENEPASAET